MSVKKWNSNDIMALKECLNKRKPKECLDFFFNFFFFEEKRMPRLMRNNKQIVIRGNEQ